MILNKFSFFQKKYKPIRDPYRNLKNRIFFIHVPKTGGTSIANALGISDYTHIKAWEVAASGNRPLLKNNFSFGVVRNPFDRFISLYNYARMDKSYYHDNLVQPETPERPRHMDYITLKNSSLKECVFLLKDGKLKHNLQWNQWVPQYTWLYDKKGKKALVKKIYHFEHLDELIKDLNDLGYAFESFPRLNASVKSDYSKLLDKESRKILENIYSKDLEYFGYNF